MSNVAKDIGNLGNSTFGEPFSFLTKNWENIYVFVWVICITVLLINTFKIDLSVDEDRKPVFKNVAVYEQFSNVCKNASKNCPNRKTKMGCTAHNCCVYAKSKNGSYCVPGDEDGPEEKQDAKGVDFDEYWYLKKRHKIE